MAYVYDQDYFNSEWAVVTAEDLSASAADHYAFQPMRPIVVTGFGFVTTEAVGDATTEAVIALDHRVTAGSDTGRVEKATITFAGGAVGGAIGDVVMCKNSTTGIVPFDPFLVTPGQQVVFEHKTAASGGTTTGAGHYFIEYHLAHNTPMNDATGKIDFVEA